MDEPCGTESPLYRYFRNTRIRQVSDIGNRICHQSRGTNLPLYRCFRPTWRMADFCLLTSSNLGRDQITLATRARHGSLQEGQGPQEFGGASLGCCLGEVHRYRQFWVLWRSREVNHRMLWRWRWRRIKWRRAIMDLRLRRYRLGIRLALPHWHGRSGMQTYRGRRHAPHLADLGGGHLQQPRRLSHPTTFIQCQTNALQLERRRSRPAQALAG